MIDNPYQGSLAYDLQEAAPAAHVAKRPLGVSILCVLHALGGVVFLSLSAMLIATYEQTADFAASKGVPFAFFLGMTLVMSALPIAIAIGLWRGRNWAWWCAACLSMSMIFNQLGRVLTVFVETDLPREALLFVAVIGAATVLVPVLVYAYYFKRNVRAYFGVRMGPVAAVGLQFAINIAIIVAFAICFIAMRVAELNERTSARRC